MKNRTITFIILCIAQPAVHLFAQTQGLHIKFSAGYSLSTPGGDKLYPLELPTNNSGRFSDSKGTLGTGFDLTAGIAKDLGSTFTLGLDMSYFGGTKLRAGSSQVPDGVNFAYTETDQATHAYWSAVPNVSAKLWRHSNYDLYMRVGLLLAFATKYEVQSNSVFTYGSITSADNVLSTATADNYRYKLSAGFQAAAGVRYRLREHIGVFAELCSKTLTASPVSDKEVDRSSGDGFPATVNNNSITFDHARSGIQTSPQTISSSTANGITTVNSKQTLIAPIHRFNALNMNLGILFSIK